MNKWLFAAMAALLFAAGAYAQVMMALPNWTNSTRFGNSPGNMGFNTTNNLPEWLDNNATWHSAARTDSPTFTGTTTNNALTITTTSQQSTGYSVAGTPLPTCNAGAKGTFAWVSDATTPTYLATYAGSGAVVAPVFCNGTSWVTY